MSMKINNKEISVIGGAGHVGFPLGLVFSAKNFKEEIVFSLGEKYLEALKLFTTLISSA